MSLAAWGRTWSLLSLCWLASGCCFTQALWSEDAVAADGKPIRERTVVAEQRHEHRVTVAVAALASGGPGLRLVGVDGPDADGYSAWQLQAVAGDDVACAVLAEPRQLGPCSVRIDAVRERQQGDVVWSAATVVLHGALDLRTVGAVVENGQLSGVVRDRLAVAARAQDAFARPSPNAVDGWLQQLDERLRALDLRLLTPGETAPWVPFACVWVDRLGEPWQPRSPLAGAPSGQPATASTAAPPSASVAAPRSFAGELAQLREVRAIVAATNGTTTRTFQLQADLAVLWSLLGGAGDGRFEMSSKWSFRGEPAAADVAAPTAETWPLVVLERAVEEVETSSAGSDFLGKLALTPLTLLADGIVGWMLSAIGVDGCGCDDDDDVGGVQVQRP